MCLAKTITIRLSSRDATDGRTTQTEVEIPTLFRQHREKKGGYPHVITSEIWEFTYEWAPWARESSSRAGSWTLSRISWIGDVMMGVEYCG